MLDVGLIGLGPDWESRYRPALSRLRRRLRVCAVYTPVFTRSDAACLEFDCHHADSISELVSHPALKGLIVLDSAWFSGVPAELACHGGKSVLLADRLHADMAARRALAASADERGVMLLPDMLHRHTPATVRLRELIATRLGRARRIRLEHSAEREAGGSAPLSRAVDDPVAMGIDWCHYVTGATPLRVRAIETLAGQVPLCWEVEFGPLADRSPPPVATLAIDPSAALRCVEDGQVSFRAVIESERGTAVVTGCHQISWQTARESREEQLTSENDAVEMLLDHFARRALGGLIPMADLNDALRALGWSAAARTARDSQVPVLFASR
jgi:predicted dehydrogenase